MAEWSKAVDLRPTINDARVRTPLRANICSYSVAVITSDFESENPSSNLGKSWGGDLNMSVNGSPWLLV